MGAYHTVSHTLAINLSHLPRLHLASHVNSPCPNAFEKRLRLSRVWANYIGTAEKLLARAEASNNLIAAGRLLKEARESAQLVGKTLGMFGDRRGDVVVNIDARVQSVLSSMGDDELVAFARQLAADRPALPQ